jgi:tetratricopeptide (TPR) repeat protein
LAALYRRSGYLDREIEALETVHRLRPADSDASFRLADIYLSLGWFGKARPCLMDAIRQAPSDRRVFRLLATQAYIRFDYAAMEKSAVEGLRRFPDDNGLTVLLSEAFRLQGKVASAEAVLQAAIDKSPDRATKAASTVGLARLLLEEKWSPPRSHDAEHVARAALRLRPRDPDACYWLGLALERQGRWKDAIPFYETTRKANPRFESVAFRLGRLYLRLPQAQKRLAGEKLLSIYRARMADDERFRNARDSVMGHPQDPGAHRRMAMEYLRAGQQPEAIVELREVLRLSPSDRAAKRQLADGLRQAGRLTEAHELERQG